MTQVNLPCTLSHAMSFFSTPEEYATAIKVTHELQTIVDRHNEERAYVTQADNEDDDQFLWGQDFDIDPDVWDNQADTSEDIEAILRGL